MQFQFTWKHKIPFYQYALVSLLQICKNSSISLAYCNTVNPRMNIVIYFLLSVNTKDILKNAEVQTSLYAIDVHCTENFFFKISGVGLAYYIYKLHCCIITFLTFFFFKCSRQDMFIIKWEIMSCGSVEGQQCLWHAEMSLHLQWWSWQPPGFLSSLVGTSSSCQKRLWLAISHNLSHSQIWLLHCNEYH